MNKPQVVAVINTSPDIVDMLRLAIEHAGYVVVSAMTHEIREGVVDLGPFVSQHEPRVIVYDIAPPYDNNWQLFQHIRSRDVMQGRYFIITTTNLAHVKKLAGEADPLFEIVGKPYDLGQVVQAIHAAVRGSAPPAAD